MKMPEQNDQKEELLRALSPANPIKNFEPSMPENIHISRLNGDGAEFVPDEVVLGLQQRLSNRKAAANAAVRESKLSVTSHRQSMDTGMRPVQKTKTTTDTDKQRISTLSNAASK